ncbi:MAG TPA: hypothetical protein VF456_07240, partial [Vicinamibacterales bacterium]
MNKTVNCARNRRAKSAAYRIAYLEGNEKSTGQRIDRNRIGARRLDMSAQSQGVGPDGNTVLSDVNASNNTM